jgi:hypothetical protein
MQSVKVQKLLIDKITGLAELVKNTSINADQLKVRINEIHSVLSQIGYKSMYQIECDVKSSQIYSGMEFTSTQLAYFIYPELGSSKKHPYASHVCRILKKMDNITFDRSKRIFKVK